MQGRSARTTSNQISTINGPAIIIWFLIDETSLDVAFSRPCDAVRDAGTQRTRRMRWTGLLAVQRLNWIFPLTSTRAFPAWKPFANLFDCSLSSPATQPGSRTLFLLLFPAPLRVRGRARGLLRLIARLARSHPSRHPPPPTPPCPPPPPHSLVFPSRPRSCSAFRVSRFRFTSQITFFVSSTVFRSGWSLFSWMPCSATSRDYAEPTGSLLAGSPARIKCLEMGEGWTFASLPDCFVLCFDSGRSRCISSRLLQQCCLLFLPPVISA